MFLDFDDFFSLSSVFVLGQFYEIYTWKFHIYKVKL